MTQIPPDTVAQTSPQTVPPAVRRSPVPPGEGALELIRRVAEGAIILGALLFAAGWSYLYGYYKSFGLSLGDIDFSAEVALVFSFPVLFSWAFLLLLAGILFIYAVLRKYLTRWLVPRSLILLVLFALTARWVSFVGVKLGETRAYRDMVKDSSLLPVVRDLKPLSEGKDGAFLCSDLRSNGSELLLLLHSGQSYFIFEPLVTIKDRIRKRNLTLCIVPEARIRYISLEVRVKEEQ